MNVIQLGNGGGLDFDKTNSSFLIELLPDNDDVQTKYILFDCGRNVYDKLIQLDLRFPEKEIVKNLSVFISHMDDDHIGSLKSLIYYRYFVCNKNTVVYCGQDLMNQLNMYLLDTDGLVEHGLYNGKNKKYVVESLLDYKSTSENCYLYSVKTHHFKICYGLFITKNDNQLYISGDTKVCKDTISCLNMMNGKFVYNNINKTLNEQDIYDYMNNNDSLTCDFNNNKKKFKTTLAFHDYSNWDSFDQQVHACKYDWEKYYCEQDGKNKFSFLKKYHDSKPILIDRLLKNEDIKFESLYTHFKLNKFCIKTNCMNTSKYIDLNLLKQIFDFNTINIFYNMENHGVTINFIFGLKDKNKYDQIKYLNLQCYYSIHDDKYSKIRFDSGNFNLFELDIFETDFFRDYIVVNSVITNRSTLSLVHLDFIKEIDHRSIYYKNGKNELKNTAMDLEKYRTYVEYKKLKEESEKIF